MSCEMKKMAYYFAYGSNLHPSRLEKRIGACSQGTLAFLPGAQLTFNKRGTDGSGKCNIDFTDSSSDAVIGVLYEVSASQKKRLDQWEAATCFYTGITTKVTSKSLTIDAFTYQAGDEHIDTGLLPFDWYKRFVFLGASHFEFPRDYLQQLAEQPSIPDDNLERNKQNAILLSELEHASGL